MGYDFYNNDGCYTTIIFLAFFSVFIQNLGIRFCLPYNVFGVRIYVLIKIQSIIDYYIFYMQSQ